MNIISNWIAITNDNKMTTAFFFCIVLLRCSLLSALSFSLSLSFSFTLNKTAFICLINTKQRLNYLVPIPWLIFEVIQVTHTHFILIDVNRKWTITTTTTKNLINNYILLCFVKMELPIIVFSLTKTMIRDFHFAN